MRDDDSVFKALADPTRRRLLDALRLRNGQTLSALASGTSISRQAVTKHLDALVAAGIVVVRREGRERLHHLNGAPINDIADRWIGQFGRQRAQALSDLRTALEAPMNDTTFVYASYIRTTPERLWEALTSRAFIARYYGGGGPHSDFAVGSPVNWQMAPDDDVHDWDQKVLESDPPRRLVYTWHNYQPEMQEMFGWSDERLAELQQEPRSKVTFEFEEPAPGVCLLTLTHDDFVPDSEMKRGVEGGWPAIMSDLKSLLETGSPVTPGA